MPETSALLTAIAVLTGDEVLRSRVRREVAARAHVLPRWLAELGRARPHDRVVEMAHVLGDGENLVLGVTLPGGSELSVAVYVDHNLGTLVKDAFVVPGALPDLIEMLQSDADDPDVTLTEIDPAEARARITEAVEHGAITFPPPESETWPSCRPLVEWAVGLLPAGGRGYVRPDWSDADRQALAERFLASPFAWTSCCGSAPTTGPVIRCAGARWPWRSCWPTGSPGRSSPTSRTWRGRRPSCGG
jgi:hypothetical protein